MSDELVDMRGLAAMLGIGYETVRKYRRVGRLPAPDYTMGRSPVWKRSTIERWRQNRPGQGRRSDLEQPSSGE